MSAHFLYYLQNFIIYSSIMTDSNDDEFDSPDLELDQHEIYPLSDEWQEDTGNLQLSAITPAVTYGPHLKFSRGNDVYTMQEEYSMIKERKFVCSLDILLAAFQARCQTPGCTAFPTIKHHFVGITLIELPMSTGT